MLGPIVNPARPQHQMTGVFSLELLRLYQFLFQQEEKNFTIVHSLDGYDEISLTGPYKLAGRTGEQLVTPEDLGVYVLAPEELYGGETVAESADIFKRILAGAGTEAQNQVVIANAANAIRCMDPKLNLATCTEAAKTSLLGRKAERSFKSLLN